MSACRPEHWVQASNCSFPSFRQHHLGQGNHPLVEEIPKTFRIQRQIQTQAAWNPLPNCLVDGEAYSFKTT